MTVTFRILSNSVFGMIQWPELGLMIASVSELPISLCVNILYKFYHCHYEISSCHNNEESNVYSQSIINNHRTDKTY
jgi:hypothetical protein